MVGRGENQRAAADVGDATVGVGLGEGHRGRGGLVQADRAGENHVDRAVAQVKGGGGSQHAGDASNDAAPKRDGGDRVVESRGIQRPARDGHVTGVREDVTSAEGYGAEIDGGAPGIGIGPGKRERAGADLGEAPAAVGRQGADGDRGTCAATAGQGHGRGGAVSARRSDDDADHGAGVDQRIARRG